MIRTVRLRNFKVFREETFRLDDSVVLAGPNNSGKSTLLQAIATWKFALDRWLAERADAGEPTRRRGVALNRLAFTVLPVRAMNLLWTDGVVSGGSRTGASRLLEIAIEGETGGFQWECAMEFHYANPEMVYVRPQGAKTMAPEEIVAFPPRAAREMNVVHAPAMFGIQRDEQRYDRGMQDLLVGQGRGGDVLRNLLLEISQSEAVSSPGSQTIVWDALASRVQDLFAIRLARPAYGPGDPYVVCEYADLAARTPRARPLDLSSLGSGTLQVLLLLAFFYARPGTVMLLDEPDAHQHVILQRDVYRMLEKIARERQAQVIVSTHSPTILNTVGPERVVTFTGGAPRRLRTKCMNANSADTQPMPEEVTG